ncbi:hypothetical protein D3C79_932800 [compost metagenome]
MTTVKPENLPGVTVLRVLRVEVMFSGVARPSVTGTSMPAVASLPLTVIFEYRLSSSLSRTP